MKRNYNTPVANITTNGHRTADRKTNSKPCSIDGAFIERIGGLLDAEEYIAAIELLTTTLKDEPDNHVLMLLTGSAYLKKGQLQESLLYHMQAVAAHPCPHSIWNLAYYMKLAGTVKWAITLWKSIIDMAGREDDPSVSVPCNNCCKVMDDRPTLIANARFMVSVSYLQTGHPRLSQRYKRDYMRDLDAGIKGMFPADTIDTLRGVTCLEYSVVP